MDAVRRLIDFYRAQIELIWNWRRGRRQLLWRAAVSFVIAFLSLGATAAVLPGVTIDSALSLSVAVVVLGLLSALVRPVLLALVAPFSMVLMLVGSLAFQVVSFLALESLVPGVRLAELVDAVIAALVFAVITSLISWAVSLDSDDSYYSMLVRRLLSRRPDATRTKTPGLVIVQIDGLAHAVLTQQVNAGRVPVMSRWLREERMRLAPWIALLPSQTSASQAGIMFGRNDDIPAFRWWDKENKSLFVSNHPADAEALELRLAKEGPGLLAEGASIGNLLSGGAERAYLTLATVRNPNQGLGRSRSYFSFFLSPYGFIHAIVLGFAEVFKEIFQSRRSRLAGIEPRMARGFPYPFLRAITNVVLRPLSTSLVIEEMLRGTSVIYVTYTDYDEIAHHSGPQRAESLDALDGVDRVLGSLMRAAEDAPRPYRFVILSDHGQTLGATFRQRFDRTLEDVIRQLMGGADSVSMAVSEVAEWRVLNAFASEMTRAKGASAVARRALRSRTRRQAVRENAQAQVAALDETELVVCPSGNLALVYFPDIDGRVTLETINERYPEMVDALAHHPGVGLLLVRSDAHGPLVIGASGVRHLDGKKVDGEDPLEPFGTYAAAALKRLDGMTNCGDLVVISMLDPDTDQVAAFEELIGSHGGLGGPQNEPLILYPQEWELAAEPLVGAPAVHDQLLAWLGRGTPAGPIKPTKPKPARSARPKPGTTSTAPRTRRPPKVVA
ncbi:MAG: phage holin family protein [Candidatus Limnocylindrales bacterium]